MDIDDDDDFAVSEADFKKMKSADIKIKENFTTKPKVLINSLKSQKISPTKKSLNTNPLSIKKSTSTSPIKS